MTDEQIDEEYKKAEKGLKYELIENAIVKKHELQVTFDELKNFIIDLLKLQMLQYGQSVPEDALLDEYVNNILQNEEEVKRATDQILKKKLVKLYQEKIPVTKKKIGYNKFLDLDKA